MADDVHLSAVALGSNLGDREKHIECALEALDVLEGSRLVARSTLWETDPVGSIEQGLYLNAAALLETSLSPDDLLDAMLAIERDRGRNRGAEERWGPRTLDLDLLLYAGRIIAHDRLTVPHPRMHERTFVLGPLSEIAPDLIHPVMRMTIRELYEALEPTPSE